MDRCASPSATRPEADARAAESAALPAWEAPLASLGRSGPAGDEVARIADGVLEGRRITPEEALFLHDHADVLTLGALADHVRRAKHPEPIVTYIVDRNVNPTNVCVTDCGFCAFYRRPGQEGEYLLTREEIVEKARETAELGGRQLLIQGGHHPAIRTDWWCDLIADLRARFPELNCHALSAPELDHLARLDKRPVEEVIRDLKAAGMGSVPGAGAEILVERVRKVIAPKKMKTERWLDVHRKVHAAGLRSSATMMFGHVETSAERVEHLRRLRELQDETGGFTAFACWNMQPEGVPEQSKYPRCTTPAIYLRVQALSRVFLDNFDNVQTSYVTQGVKMAQVTLRYGCNDFGGTMLEENVVSAAGCSRLESIQGIEHAIERAGFLPRQRNSWYGIVDPRHDGATFPGCAEEAAVTADAQEAARSAKAEETAQ